MKLRPYPTTIIAASFTCCMGVLYLFAYHIENAPDSTIRDAFVAGVTLLSGSVTVERMAGMVNNRNTNGATNGSKEADTSTRT